MNLVVKSMDVIGQDTVSRTPWDDIFYLGADGEFHFFCCVTAVGLEHEDELPLGIWDRLEVGGGVHAVLDKDGGASVFLALDNVNRAEAEHAVRAAFPLLFPNEVLDTVTWAPHDGTVVHSV